MQRAVSYERITSAKESEGALKNVLCVQSHFVGDSSKPNWDTIGMIHPKLGEAPSPNIIRAIMGKGGASIMLSCWFMTPA